ncbi:hypothetical protein CsSME_00046335 [Camellia sinensis var. sinensis]
MVGESPGHENNAVVWWPTRKDAPKTKKASCLTRKLAGRGRSGRPGEILVSHPCTTFQTRKTRGNKVWFKNHAKRRKLSGPKTRRAAKGSKNRKLVSKQEKWSTKTKRRSTRPLPPSGRRKQDSVHKPSRSTKEFRGPEASTTCTITERSIDDMADDIPYGGDPPYAEDEPDIIPLPPRIQPFDPEEYDLEEHILPPSTFYHFTDFLRRAPADLLLREPESLITRMRYLPVSHGVMGPSSRGSGAWSSQTLSDI